MFDHAAMFHLPCIQSDHRPFLIKLHSFQTPPMSSQPFKFQAAWTSHSNFDFFVQEAWDPNLPFIDSLLPLSNKPKY